MDHLVNSLKQKPLFKKQGNSSSLNVHKESIASLAAESASETTSEAYQLAAEKHQRALSKKHTYMLA
jgi:hypothetical protein